ncbi:hypothetical protein QQ045_010317 [Rhodiola kirilowii]
MKVKVDNGWSDKSFNDHLRLTQDLLPSPNNYPGSYSEVKRLLKNLGMGYEIIHACEFDCALFYKDFKNLEHCPMCNESRYLDGDVDRRIPRKVVRYFPLTPRLQRLYMSPHIAKMMQWHRERKVKKVILDILQMAKHGKSLIKNILTLHETLGMCVLDWLHMASIPSEQQVFLIASVPKNARR